MTYPPGATASEWSVQYPLAADPATMNVLAMADVFVVYGSSPFG